MCYVCVYSSIAVAQMISGTHSFRSQFPLTYYHEADPHLHRDPVIEDGAMYTNVSIEMQIYLDPERELISIRIKLITHWRHGLEKSTHFKETLALATPYDSPESVVQAVAWALPTNASVLGRIGHTGIKRLHIVFAHFNQETAVLSKDELLDVVMRGVREDGVDYDLVTLRTTIEDDVWTPYECIVGEMTQPDCY